MNQPDFTSCSSLLSPPLTCLYLSPSNTPSFHCDGWMDERGRRGRRKPTPRGSGSPLPPPFFSATILQPHLTPCPLSPSPCPFLALSHHYVLTLTRPALQIGFAQEWQERERERMWLAPFHLPRLQDQIIGFCLRIEDNCSLYSVPSKCMILTPRSPLALK